MSKDLEKIKNVEIFDGVKFDDLLHEIYRETGSKRDKIKTLIRELAPFITNISNATLIAPVIGEYLDISIKNEDQLIKLAGIIQKHIKDTSKSKAGDEDEGMIPQQEIDAIREAARSRNRGKIVEM